MTLIEASDTSETPHGSVHDVADQMFAPDAVVAAIRNFRDPVTIVRDNDTARLGIFRSSDGEPGDILQYYDLIGRLPSIYPEWLGDRLFTGTHGVRFPYVVGEMARGIASSAMVIAAARAGLLGFFGAAGLAPEKIEAAIDEIEAAIGAEGLPWGVNLIHSPNEHGLENALVDLYLRRGVRTVCASAFMSLSAAIVRYAVTGLTIDSRGHISRRNAVFAKISRAEVAAQFMAPAPDKILDTLVKAGQITEQERELARRVPVAEDITAEADSGGHTDNRPQSPQFASLMQARDAAMRRYGFARPIRIGVGGGIGTPNAVAAAFALGAAYVVTGSINQASIESGISPQARKMLSEASMTDVAMAPSADMFEMGVKVQVLKKGTLFAQRATRLYELYRGYQSIEEIPAEARAQIEHDIFKRSLDEVWRDTEKFFERNDPAALRRAQSDSHHRMALVFRWYLGLSSRWPIIGEEARRLDFQIWCGPAQGAFNAWAAGSFLSDIENRSIAQIALNMLEGAAAITRAHQLRSMGLDVPSEAFHFVPRPLAVQ